MNIWTWLELAWLGGKCKGKTLLVIEIFFTLHRYCTVTVQYWCSVFKAKRDQVFSVPCWIGPNILHNFFKLTVLPSDSMKRKYGCLIFTIVYRRIEFHEFLISLFLFPRSINCSWVFLVETTFWTNGRTTNWWHIINTWRKYHISWELTKGTIHLLRKQSFRLFTPPNHPTYHSGRWTEKKKFKLLLQHFRKKKHNSHSHFKYIKKHKIKPKNCCSAVITLCSPKKIQLFSVHLSLC